MDTGFDLWVMCEGIDAVWDEYGSDWVPPAVIIDRLFELWIYLTAEQRRVYVKRVPKDHTPMGTGWLLWVSSWGYQITENLCGTEALEESRRYWVEEIPVKYRTAYCTAADASEYISWVKG